MCVISNIYFFLTVIQQNKDINLKNNISTYRKMYEHLHQEIIIFSTLTLQTYPSKETDIIVFSFLIITSKYNRI